MIKVSYHDILYDNDNLWIPGYELIIVDHPSNQKYNLSVNGKQCNITLIYRSPSQSSEDFDPFLSNFELLLDNIANRNPFVSIFLVILMQGQKIGVLVMKQLMKTKTLNP